MRQKIIMIVAVLVAFLIMIPVFSYADLIVIDEEVHMLAGGGIGLGYHTIGVSGLTTGATGVRASSGANFLLYGMGDFGIFNVGFGDIGVIAHLDFLAPDLYIGIAATPRYKVEMLFDLSEPLYSIAPWVGWNFQFGFVEFNDFEFVFNTGLSTGVEVQLFVENLYFTLSFDWNFIGTGVGQEVTTVNPITDDPIIYSWDYDYTNYFTKLGVLYAFM